MISVAFGAYARHGLRQTAEHFRFLMTVVRYNQMHVVVVIIIGIALLNGGRLTMIPAFRWSGVLFVIGTILFSSSIYLAVSLAIQILLSVTPVGSMTIMAAWLLGAGLLARKRT